MHGVIWKSTTQCGIQISRSQLCNPLTAGGTFSVTVGNDKELLRHKRNGS